MNVNKELKLLLMGSQEEQLKKANAIIFKLLARREYSQQELRQKLVQKDYPEDIIANVLKELINSNMQSDYRVAEMLLSHGYKSGWGPNKIKAQMQAKGLEESVIDKVFSSISSSCLDNNLCQANTDASVDKLTGLNKQDKLQNLQNLISELKEYHESSSGRTNSFDYINWEQLAIQVAEKKFGQALASLANKYNNTWEFKAKVQRFLYNRGFEAEQIDKTIKSYNLEYS